MRKYNLLALAAASLFVTHAAIAKDTRFYLPAQCHDSYLKFGPNQEDLSKKKGLPITCDMAVISLLDNGGVLVHVFSSNNSLSPLGFAGYEGMEHRDGMSVLSLSRIFYPSNNNTSDEHTDGIEGTCFFGKDKKEKDWADFSCAARVDLGDSRLVYKLNVRITGKAELMPLGKGEEHE